MFPPGSPLNWPLHWDEEEEGEEEEEEDGDDATADDNDSLEPRAKCQRIMKVLYSVFNFCLLTSVQALKLRLFKTITDPASQQPE